MGIQAVFNEIKLRVKVICRLTGLICPACLKKAFNTGGIILRINQKRKKVPPLSKCPRSTGCLLTMKSLAMTH